MQDDSYKVWTTARAKSPTPTEPTREAPTLSRTEELATKTLSQKSTGRPTVTSSVYGSSYILAYEPRAKGVPLLMLEGFPSEEAMAMRVKEVRYAKGTVTAAYNVATRSPLRVKILGGEVSFFAEPSQKVVEHVPASAQKSPEAMLRWAEREARVKAKARPSKTPR